MGVTIRHYFNSLHARRGTRRGHGRSTALLFVHDHVAGRLRPVPPVVEHRRGTGPALRFAQAKGSTGCIDIFVRGRVQCMCHAQNRVGRAALAAEIRCGRRPNTRSPAAPKTRSIWRSGCDRCDGPLPNLEAICMPANAPSIVAWFNAATQITTAHRR